MTRQAAIGTGMLTLAGCDMALAAVSILRYPAMLAQHGAWQFVAELGGALAVYAIAAARLATMRGERWQTICLYGGLFGCLTGGIEVLNLAIENCFPAFAHQAPVSIGFMLGVFSLWGIAGHYAGRASKSIQTGVWAAVLSAALCMLIAVTAGFLLEFYLAQPDTTVIATWPEFQRSGWTDVRAFGLANTLDSGFTHLVIAPVVACATGVVGSYIAWFRRG